MKDLLTKREAVFSPCRSWRYVLSIGWDDRLPAMCFLMLNPSTADEFKNDPTVARCEKRARDSGNFGSLIILNAYAWRSTDPGALKLCADPIGPENDFFIGLTLRVLRDTGGIVVCAWGNHCAATQRTRPAQLYGLIRRAGLIPHALRLSEDGTPWHPLYLPYSLRPLPISKADQAA